MPQYIFDNISDFGVGSEEVLWWFVRVQTEASSRLDPFQPVTIELADIDVGEAAWDAIPVTVSRIGGGRVVFGAPAVPSRFYLFDVGSGRIRSASSPSGVPEDGEFVELGHWREINRSLQALTNAALWRSALPTRRLNQGNVDVDVGWWTATVYDQVNLGTQRLRDGEVNTFDFKTRKLLGGGLFPWFWVGAAAVVGLVVVPQLRR